MGCWKISSCSPPNGTATAPIASRSSPAAGAWRHCRRWPTTEKSSPITQSLAMYCRAPAPPLSYRLWKTPCARPCTRPTRSRRSPRSPPTRDRGADVVLVTAPTALPDPPLVRVESVKSAQDMCDAVLYETSNADALIMAAAVADYRPAFAAEQKMKKTAADEMSIDLEKTTDILATATGNFVRVGFSAESENLEANAADKVRRKSLDLIVANDITEEGSGFGVDTNRVVLIDREMQVERLPLLTKYEVGHRILDRVSALLGNRTGVG